MKLYIKSIITMMILYIIQFVIMPLVFPKFFPKSNEAYAIFIISSFIVLIFAFYLVNNKILPWIIADSVYSIMIIVYAGKGAYGIGMRGINLDGLQSKFIQSEAYIGAIISLCVIILIQLTIKAIALTINYFNPQ